MRMSICILLVGLICSGGVFAQSAIHKDPYIGAMVMDAWTGAVLFEEGADRPVYPASVTKLMDMYIVLEAIHQGRLSPGDMVRVDREAESMGGTQVYLAAGESFPVEELLYALMIQSANDAAMALAKHVSGTKEAFVGLMNQKARELGLSSVAYFQSPHGLPPDANRRPDMMTPRDVALLSRALLLKYPEVLDFTSATFRVFRPAKPFDLRTHNRHLKSLPGCDGLKTGYFKAAGYSISVTVERDGRRVIVVVMGSSTAQVRDAKVVELTEQYLPLATPRSAVVPPAPIVVAPPVAAVSLPDDAGAEDAAPVLEEVEPVVEEEPRRGGRWGLWLLGGLVVVIGGFAMYRRRLVKGLSMGRVTFRGLDQP